MINVTNEVWLEQNETNENDQSDFYKWTTTGSDVYKVHNFPDSLNNLMITTEASNFSVASTEENTILDYVESIGDVLVFYYTPTVVFVGTVGNILSVLVFFRTKLKKLSSSYYLAALGLSDTCFLILSFMTWLNFADIHLTNHDIVCQLYYYLQGVCSFLSVWYVVAFTVERFIAVLYPLKRQSFCTVRRAVMVLIGLTVIGCLFCAPLLYFFSPIYHMEANATLCDVVEEYKIHMKIFNYVDTVTVFIIPFTAIVILNTITGYTVWKVAGIRRSMTQQRNIRCNLKEITSMTPNTTAMQRCLHPNGQNSIRKPATAITGMSKNVTGRCQRTGGGNAASSQMKVTKMLLLVSTVFVILNLPSYLIRVMAYLESEPATQPSKVTIILQYYSWLFFITNFGINFVLYCVSGQNFRKAVIAMFSKRIQKRQQMADCGTQVTVVTEYSRTNTARTLSTYRQRPSTNFNNTNNYETANINNFSMIMDNNNSHMHHENISDSWIELMEAEHQYENDKYHL